MPERNTFLYFREYFQKSKLIIQEKEGYGKLFPKKGKTAVKRRKNLPRFTARMADQS